MSGRSTRLSETTDLAQTVGVIVSIVLGSASLAHAVSTETRNRRAATLDRLGALYDQIVVARVSNPDVLALGRRWEPGSLKLIDAGDASSVVLARYYSYGELCVGFCVNVLEAIREGVLDREAADRRFGGLIRLLVEENDALFHDIAAGPYCPAAFADWFHAIAEKRRGDDPLKNSSRLPEGWLFTRSVGREPLWRQRPAAMAAFCKWIARPNRKRRRRA